MEQKPNGLYFVSFEYYDEYRDKDAKDQCLVIAPDASKAIEPIVKDYKYINEITVKEWVRPNDFGSNVNCIYLPDNQHIIDAIENANEY